MPSKPRGITTRRFALSSLIGTVLLIGCSTDFDDALREALQERIDDSSAEIVSIYFHDLNTGDSVIMNGDVRMHAASTMKVPVMIQVFRDASAGWYGLDDSLQVTDTFRSIVDGSPYALSIASDSDSSLYKRLGDMASVRELTELMITVSSNLATNILIQKVGAPRVQHTMRELGADSIEVLRGVEDIKAFEAGMSNTTTARDLGVIMAAIALGDAANDESNQAMLEILRRQRFNDGIPVGLPPEAKVAHKTGLITRINHDAAIVEIADGRRYVLVVLVRGIDEPTVSDTLIADLSRIVYEHVSRTN